MARGRLAGQAGFTIIEALVAATILLTGVVGTFALVSTANSSSSAVKAREGATNLGREVAEEVRTMRFDELAPGFDAELRTRPGLADVSPAAGWQVERRKITYTLTPAVCAVDDGGDGYGDHAAGGFCPDSTITNSLDASPEDLKRASFSVAFTDRGQTTSISTTATVSSTGQTRGVPVTFLELSSPTVATPAEPVIVTSVTSLTFLARASATATNVIWSLDGSGRTPDPTRLTSTDWSFTWNVAGVSDGTYDVTAQAVDSGGEVGPPRTIKVQLARNGASAPTGFVGGYNAIRDGGVTKDVAELQWLANTNERNVVGYRLYRPNGTLACPSSAAVLSQATSCIDFTPPTDTGTVPQRTYTVKALYYNASGLLTEGSAALREVKPTLTPTSTAAPRPTDRHKLGTTSATGTNCASGALNMRATLDAAGTPFGSPSVSRSWCSPTYLAGDTVSSPLLFVGAITNAITHPTKTCSITVEFGYNGIYNGSVLKTFGKSQTSGTYTWSYAFGGAATLNAGDRLGVRVTWSAADSECSSVKLTSGGASASELTVDGTRQTTTSVSSRPDPPTNLRKAAPVNGTVKLSWDKPAAGAPVEFYRVYKATTNYTDRIDTVGDGTGTSESYEVPDAAALYYVAAVGPSLVELTPIGPISP